MAVAAALGMMLTGGAVMKVSMSHIAVSEVSGEGVTWLEPVDDMQYPK